MVTQEEQWDVNGDSFGENSWSKRIVSWYWCGVTTLSHMDARACNTPKYSVRVYSLINLPVYATICINTKKKREIKNTDSFFFWLFEVNTKNELRATKLWYYDCRYVCKDGSHNQVNPRIGPDSSVVAFLFYAWRLNRSFLISFFLQFCCSFSPISPVLR